MEEVEKLMNRLDTDFQSKWFASSSSESEEREDDTEEIINTGELVIQKKKKKKEKTMNEKRSDWKNTRKQNNLPSEEYFRKKRPVIEVRKKKNKHITKLDPELKEALTTLGIDTTEGEMPSMNIILERVRTLVLECHPDKPGGSKEQFVPVWHSYKVLCSHYDR
eukprot:GFUD01005708.1.p1 GENE.GFUD01005708.1~~GFUD01005708.1.p1  ORF type:complete len:192 (-),score=63.94 GFUD01005708.1:159-650(-)